jgi:hypothetical protein
MDAWNDIMGDLDDPDAGMTTVHCAKGDFVLLELSGMKGFKDRCPEQHEALLECSVFVNYARLDLGKHPLLMLAFLEQAPPNPTVDRAPRTD